MEGMIFLLSCNHNKWKWDTIRDGWLNSCGLPYVIVVGNEELLPTSHRYDPDSHVLELGCMDNYDGLVYKIAYGIDAVIQRFNPDFVVKVDDDVVLKPSRLQVVLTKIDPVNTIYAGNIIEFTKPTTSKSGIEKYTLPENKQPVVIEPVDYCAGPIYYLGKRAMEILQTDFIPQRIKFEDVNVGLTLNSRGIRPYHLPFYTNYHTNFMKEGWLAWHDIYREHPQNIKPVSHTFTKIGMPLFGSRPT